MRLSLLTLFLLISLIILSAFFSSSETAISSVNKIRLKKFANEGRRGSKRALQLVKNGNFDKTLSTILVGNNIVNIAAASISATLATELFGGNTGVIVSTVIMTILILIFGEILPKSLAKEHAETYSLAVSNILYILIKLLSPINSVFLKIKTLVSKAISKNNKLPTITEDEIKVILGIGEKEGVIDKVERELIHRSLKLDETSVREILTPRMDMVAIDCKLSIEEIKTVFFKERYSRVPVYENSIDNIIGFLNEKEFLTRLLKGKDVNIIEMLREPLFVVESMKVSTLLPRLQKEQVPMAIVVNEFGETVGIVTLEDILEEIVGEILDENEEQMNLMSQINDKTFIFDAQCHLRDFAKIVNVSQPKSTYFTLGGWMMENLEDIPSIGDSFNYENLRISIDEVEGRRVRKVKVDIGDDSQTKDQ
jgi:putative hemolysin